MNQQLQLQKRSKPIPTWRVVLVVAIGTIRRNGREENSEQTEPVGYIGGVELPVTDLVSLLSRHPVPDRRCLLRALARDFVPLGVLLRLADCPAVTAADGLIMALKNVGSAEVSYSRPTRK